MAHVLRVPIETLRAAIGQSGPASLLDRAWMLRMTRRQEQLEARVADLERAIFFPAEKRRLQRKRWSRE